MQGSLVVEWHPLKKFNEPIGMHVWGGTPHIVKNLPLHAGFCDGGMLCGARGNVCVGLRKRERERINFGAVDAWLVCTCFPAFGSLCLLPKQASYYFHPPSFCVSASPPSARLLRISVLLLRATILCAPSLLLRQFPSSAASIAVSFLVVCLRRNMPSSSNSSVLVTQSLLWPDSAADGKDWRIKASAFPRSDHPSQTPAKGAFESCLKSFGRRSGLEKYYEQQNEVVKEFEGLDELVESGGRLEDAQRLQAERDAVAQKEKFAIRVSNYANLVLFAAKVFVSVKSGSLAIIASTLDSLLDLLSGFILWFTAHTMRRPNPYLYPIGKNRMQPVGILVFASVMATLGLQILIESARQLLSKDAGLVLSGTKLGWVIGIMVFVSVVKFFLMLLCRAFKNEIVRAYADDHFFDVITNVIGLVSAILASEFRWWIDPAGAIVLAMYTIWNWSKTVLENVKSLVGKTASPYFLQKLTYLCWNHHEDVRQIDTVRAYTFGGYYFVEVDIVLPSDMPLKDAHDIGESLQNKLEYLPEIERAFVHLDYEVLHRPEHSIQI